jgi:integrase
MMALTFVRTTELIGARWEKFEFDGERGTWRIPAVRMKMRDPHIAPLARQTVALLNQLRKVTKNGEFLFPGDRNARQPISNNTLLFSIYRMGYHSRMTGHGFRGVASTILHEQGYEHGHIEL